MLRRTDCRSVFPLPTMSLQCVCLSGGASCTTELILDVNTHTHTCAYTRRAVQCLQHLFTFIFHYYKTRQLSIPEHTHCNTTLKSAPDDPYSDVISCSCCHSRCVLSFEGSQDGKSHTHTCLCNVDLNQPT